MSVELKDFPAFDQALIDAFVQRDPHAANVIAQRARNRNPRRLMLQLVAAPRDGYFALPEAVRPPIEFVHAMDLSLEWMRKEFPEFDASAVKQVKTSELKQHSQVRFEFMWVNTQGSTRVRAAVVSADRPVFRTNVRGAWVEHEDAEHTVRP